jgi:hypothetical protein
MVTPAGAGSSSSSIGVTQLPATAASSATLNQMDVDGVDEILAVPAEDAVAESPQVSSASGIVIKPMPDLEFSSSIHAKKRVRIAEPVQSTGSVSGNAAPMDVDDSESTATPAGAGGGNSSTGAMESSTASKRNRGKKAPKSSESLGISIQVAQSSASNSQASGNSASMDDSESAAIPAGAGGSSSSTSATEPLAPAAAGIPATSKPRFNPDRMDILDLKVQFKAKHVNIPAEILRPVSETEELLNKSKSVLDRQPGGRPIELSPRNQVCGSMSEQLVAAGFGQFIFAVCQGQRGTINHARVQVSANSES